MRCGVGAAQALGPAHDGDHSQDGDEQGGGEGEGGGQNGAQEYLLPDDGVVVYHVESR